MSKHSSWRDEKPHRISWMQQFQHYKFRSFRILCNIACICLKVDNNVQVGNRFGFDKCLLIHCQHSLRFQVHMQERTSFLWQAKRWRDPHKINIVGRKSNFCRCFYFQGKILSADKLQMYGLLTVQCKREQIFPFNGSIESFRRKKEVSDNHAQQKFRLTHFYSG